MLKDFFKLNSPIKVFKDEEELTKSLRNSNDLRNVLFQPDTLGPPDTTNRDSPFTGKTFTNVSFAKTTITGVIFRDCSFIDCLFIGTHFVSCEFHRCTFKGCNPHKVVFKDTYINPSVFEGMLHPVEHSNIGINLFQQLYNNSTQMHQPEFADTAEFNRSKWLRYNLNYQYPGWKKKDPKFISEWLKNYLFYILAGYGIRSKFWVAWGSIVLVISVAVNFFSWDCLRITGRDGLVVEREFIKALYYTVTIPVGVGDLTPASGIGRLIFLGEAFWGLVVLSLFVTWLVKRAMR